MEKLKVTVAVTGMNATDNPAPGVAVARSLRHEPQFAGRVIGLGYDSLDPGFYADRLLDGGVILPYPSSGRDALAERLNWVREEFGLDVFMPTLDSELRGVLAIAADLERAGTRTFLPTPESLERVSKSQLPKLASDGKIDIPDSEPVMTVDALIKLGGKMGYPLVVKGVYYGAVVAHSEADAIAAFHKFAAQWGLPIIVQQFIAGEEYNISGLGDGKGNMAGAVAMRKTMLTDKGKGWCGVAIKNPELLAVTEAIIGAVQWRGPLEVEVLRDAHSGTYYVIEINPRFPAWIYLSAGAGLNLPYLAVRLALGLPLPHPLPDYRAGTMFVRISLDQIADLSTFEQLSSVGVLRPAEEHRVRSVGKDRP